MKYSIKDELDINGIDIVIIHASDSVARTESGELYTETFYDAVTRNNIHLFIPECRLEDGTDVLKYKTNINNFASVGCIDANKYPKQYKIWTDMIYRCYRQTNSIYPYFGGVGITCCPAWECFEYFMRDWKYISGYREIYKEPTGVFVIDFDIRTVNLPEYQRVYKYSNTVIRKYYGSQVCAARNLVKEQNGTPFIPIKNYNKLKKEHSTTYDNISPEKALKGYAKPEEFVSKEVWPLKGPIVPIDIHATNKNVELKEMVTIVDKDKK